MMQFELVVVEYASDPKSIHGVLCLVYLSSHQSGVSVVLHHVSVCSQQYESNTLCGSEVTCWLHHQAFHGVARVSSRQHLLGHKL